MSTTVAVGAPVGVGSAAPRQDRGIGSLRSEDFFRIMISELRQQDPLQPAKTADMIGQVSQIRSIELSGKLTTTLDQLARQQRTAGASDLLGKYVAAQTATVDGRTTVVEGVVTGVRYTGDGLAILDLDNGGQVPASAVTLVTTVEQHEAAQTAAATRGATAKIQVTRGGEDARGGLWASLQRLFTGRPDAPRRVGM